METTDTVEKLQHLIDDDPAQAINEALLLSGDIETELMKAATLVDAGELVGDYKSVFKGVQIFREVIAIYQDNPSLKYNLANGLRALATSMDYKGFIWYQETEDLRLEARLYFYSAANTRNTSPDIKSRSYTNLGNLLWSSYRWVEAYDLYTLALTEDPRNGVASSGAIKMLKYGLQQKLGDYELLVAEIEYLATHVRKNKDTIYAYAGGYGLKGIVDEIKEIRSGNKKKPVEKGDEYENFVVSNNLTLSPTIHSYEHDSKYWDNVNISAIGIDLSENSSVPEIFAMINILKSDYILSRQLYFDASNRLFKETGSYNDTLNHACYGVNESALALAQRSALDILDKIAVATLSYLNIGGAKRTSFKEAWFKESKRKGNVKEFKPKILQEIKKGNTALLALTEVARDLSSKAGYMFNKQASRNSSTHRFTVLHNLSEIPTSATGCLEHFDYDMFMTESLRTLKLARSSIIYFVQMVLFREERLDNEEKGFVMPLIVPAHKNVRDSDR